MNMRRQGEILNKRDAMYVESIGSRLVTLADELSVVPVAYDDSTLDVDRFGNYALPQVGPIPYTGFATEVTANYGETRNQYSEYHCVKVVDESETVFRAVYDNGGLFLTGLNDSDYDDSGTSVAAAKRVDTMLTLVEADRVNGLLIPQGETEVRTELLSKPFSHLGKLGLEFIGQHGDFRKKVAAMVLYDTMFNSLTVNKIDDGLFFALRSQWQILPSTRLNSKNPAVVKRLRANLAIPYADEGVFAEMAHCRTLTEVASLQGDTWQPDRMVGPHPLTKAAYMKKCQGIALKIIHHLERSGPVERLEPQTVQSQVPHFN